MVRDTSMGGGAEVFPDTAWSSVLSAEPDNAGRRASLNRLLEQYWRPVYTFIRKSGARSIEDAKDLTQGFFVRTLDGDFFARFSPEKGRFRHFLKAALRHYLVDMHRSESSVKRGAQAVIVPLDVDTLETGAFLSDPRAITPEDAFDRQWMCDVLAGSWETVRQALIREGKMVQARAYELYEMEPSADGRTTYDSVAQTIGCTSHQVKEYLQGVRSRLEQAIREQVSRVVASPDELIEEMNDLFRK